MRDDQFAPGTIAARFAKDKRPPTFDMDDERELSRMRRPPTLRALAEASVRIWIQEKGIPAGQAADSIFRFDFGHASLPAG